MSYKVTSLTGSAITSGQSVSVNIGTSAVIIYNASYRGFLVQDPRQDATFIPPNTADIVLLQDTDLYVKLYVEYTLSSPVTATDTIIIIALNADDLSREIHSFPFSIGNIVAPSITSIINDGNANPTTVVEATQTGNTSGNSNFYASNGGALLVGEWTGAAYNTLLQTIPNAVAGSTNVIINKSGNFFTNIRSKLTVDGATTIGGNTAVTGSLSATSNLSTGGTLSATGASSLDNGAITTNGSGFCTKWYSQSTVLAGIPGIVAFSDTLVTVNTAVTILTYTPGYTAPSGSSYIWFRISPRFAVPSTNTNNGLISFNVTYRDPLLGEGAASQKNFNLYNGTVLNALAFTKGAVGFCVPMTIAVLPANSIIINYRNNVAGTIGDQASIIIELLG
jgi:hypothetical protein